MKIRTQDELESYIARDFKKRMEELRIVRQGVQHASKERLKTSLRVGVVFLYAHWDRFIKIAIAELEALKCLCPDGLIFPNRNIDSKPNRFIALISTDNPKGVGEQIEGAVKKGFKSSAHTALKENGITAHTDFNKQIDSFLEIYWVLLPYDNN